MKKIYFLMSIFFLLGIFSLVEAEAKIKFPVAELGSCASEVLCRAYCDKEENILACVSFGQKNGLISEKEAEQARKFADVLSGGGPGNCNSEKSCEAYCENVGHIDECLAFAEKHDLIPKEELAEARLVAKVLKEGTKLPGGCTDKKSCETYCEVGEHIEECFLFAEQAGFMNEEEVAHARKALPLIVASKSPGGCKSKTECENYCGLENNLDECLVFAEEAGFLSQAELEMARKTGGRGPGGCQSRESCESFCNLPENQSICFDFAREHNLIPEEKLKEFESMRQEGMIELRQGLTQMPPEMRSCFEKELGSETMAKIVAGEEVAIGLEMREVMEKCAQVMQEIIRSQTEERFNQAPHPEFQSGQESFPEGFKSIIKEGFYDQAPILPPVEIEGGLYPTEMMPAGSEEMMLQNQITPPPEMMGQVCENFSLIPSCDYVPENFRDLCRQCQNQ